MGERYQAALNRAGINTAGPQLYWQLRSPAGGRVRVLEIGISVRTAPSTAPAFQISRATASLGTASTSVNGRGFDGAAPTSGAVFESAWSAAPTIDTAYHRMMALATTAGGGFIWTFYDRPLILAVSNALQITNANASGTNTGSFDAYVVWEE